MSDSDETISIDRIKIQTWPSPYYIFWLIDSIPFKDAYQACLYVNRLEKNKLEYQPFRSEADMFGIPLDAMFDFATPESVIQSLRLFHHEFLTKHGITIPAYDSTRADTIELPPDL